MNQSPESPAAARGAPSIALRLLRAVLLLGLIASLSLFLVLAIASACFTLNPDWLVPFPWVVARGPKPVSGWFFGALLLGPPLLLTGLVWRLRLRSWWWIGGGWLAVAPVLAYLATDDPTVRRSVSVEDIAPAFSGAEPGYELLMRHAKGRPAARDFVDPTLGLVWPKNAQPEEYLPFVEAHRAALAQRWAASEPIRAWYAELNAFARIGDLSQAGYDTELPAFPVHRAFMRLARAQATLLVLDGHADEAAATVLPLLGVGRKMQFHARTLVRAHIGLALQREGLRAVEFMLDRGGLSPAARDRLAQELAAGGGGEAGIRRIIATEYASLAAIIPDPAWGGFFSREYWVKALFNPVSHFLLNRNRTINLLGELATEVEDLAARRQLDRLDRQRDAFFAGPGRPGFKNVLGVIMIRNAYPGMGFVADTYWKTEDHRAALLTRLRAP